eukprot:jgi/Ulvmu1/522/UM001_0530.1
MPVLSGCLRDAQCAFVAHTPRTVPRRQVFKQARAPSQHSPRPANNGSSAQEFGDNVNSVWQQANTAATSVARHPAGLFSLGAFIAILVITVFKRVWGALGFGKSTVGSQQGTANPLLAILHRIFPRNRARNASEDNVWPGRLPDRYTPSQGDPTEQAQELSRAPEGRVEKTHEAQHMRLAQMSGVVKQASQKVAALEQLVAALKTQVRVAERRAGHAEAEAASLGNKLSTQDANAAKVQQLTQQLNAAEHSLSDKTQALATANNEIRSLQQARQLMLADEQRSADRLEQESLSHSSDVGGLRNALEEMRQQLATNEAALTDAQARQQDLLQQLTGSQEAKRSVEATLLQGAEDKVQLEASLSEAEAKAESLQLSLDVVRASLSAAEAQREAYASQVKDLQRELEAAAASVRAKDESIAGMQQQLQAVQQQLREREEVVLGLQEDVADSAALAVQLQQLRSDMAQLEELREAALQEAAAATSELKQVQQEVADAVAAIAAQGEAEAGSAEAGAALPPAVAALSTLELQRRAREQEDLLRQLRQQAAAFEEELPLQSRRELALLRSQLDTLNSRTGGPAEPPASDLASAQAEVRSAAQALLRDMLSPQQFRALEEVQRHIEAREASTAALQAAGRLSLQERVAGVLGRQAERARQEMLAEVAAAEAAADARVQARLTEAATSAEAQRSELAAWKQQQEAALAARAEESSQQAQQEAQQQEAALQDQRRELQAKAAELQAQATEQAELQAELQALQAQYGQAEAAAARAAELQQLQEQLVAQRAQVEAAQAQAREVAARADADASQAADDRSKAEAARQAADAQQRAVSQREAELAGKEQHVAVSLGGLNKQLEDARALADREIAQAREAAAAETSALKEQIQALQAAQGAETEAAQAGLRDKVTSLERELFALKDRYSRQFIDYKQKLDVAEDRIRRLRRELAERADGGASSPQATPSAGPGPGEPGGVGSVAPGASSVQDVSAWASQLVTKLSEESDEGSATDGVSTATAEAPAAPGVQHAPSWPPGESLTATGTAVAAPPAPPAETETGVLRLLSSGHCIPHPAKRERGGEDAHFVLGSYAIGVADGVGGWSKNGVDPGEYSRELMRQTAQALRRDRRRSMSCIDALTAAHDVVNVPGTCTAIVARMLDESHLEVANLGDSGLRIIRDGEIVFATESLQHGFNMPFQLGNKEIIPHTDLPDAALRTVVEVEAGDVVIMASDGFFDNVWDKDLARLVKNSCLFDGYEEENCVEHMAEKLAQVAAENSKDSELRTPWSVACSQNKNVGLLKKLFPKGGKVDDISVVVAQIEAPGDS